MLIKLGDKEAKAREDEREGGVSLFFLSESKRTASAKAK